ncbi:pyridine nucleotide-disulfide oxidoreductase domain-containing protein 2 [Alligator sinensis]|uniref:Pyridine nucleotide-disulfide oxidoreductase domain-containing protein 2 n=1 Tax=Alligator sinensis TaxID=38654 RepID=A0A3Q0HHI8_ALLSI|nr:pyridine nucleotide-disulfide oxidoreductase domain-containing protein 2 [Alligator sinensis]
MVETVLCWVGGSIAALIKAAATGQCDVPAGFCSPGPGLGPCRDPLGGKIQGWEKAPASGGWDSAPLHPEPLQPGAGPVLAVSEVLAGEWKQDLGGPAPRASSLEVGIPSRPRFPGSGFPMPPPALGLLRAAHLLRVLEKAGGAWSRRPVTSPAAGGCIRPSTHPCPGTASCKLLMRRQSPAQQPQPQPLPGAEMAAGLGRRLGTARTALGLPSQRLAHPGARAQLQPEYDAVVIGAGHNGLVAAAYLQKSGVRTAVLERRHVLGGAAVTEEIIPGFKFSRASYLLSLLRPQIYKDLELQRHGLRLHPRDPYSFTPVLEARTPPRSLLLGHDVAETQRQIARFSPRDAEVGEHRGGDPPGPGLVLGKQLPQSYQVLTAPISKVLDQWFESEPLKATLATDAVIGAMASPHTPGSGYVLLHHVMGELQGQQGAWAYVAGGMGALSQAIACAAAAHGAHIFTEKPVARVLVGTNGAACGVALGDGTELRTRLVLSNASPQHTFLQLVPQEQLPAAFVRQVAQLDTRSPVTKINGRRLSGGLEAAARVCTALPAPAAGVSVSPAPDARSGRGPALRTPARGSPPPGRTGGWSCRCPGLVPGLRAGERQGGEEVAGGLGRGGQHCCTALSCTRPLIELCIPSALDPSLAPPGCHVVSLFTQYTPYTLAGGRPWGEQEREAYADRVFNCVEDYAPGFKASVVGRDVLTPADLERVFGLPGGNIFHGGMSLDQLYFARPVPSYAGYRSPIPGLYLCGSGAHPGTRPGPEGWGALGARLWAGCGLALPCSCMGRALGHLGLALPRHRVQEATCPGPCDIAARGRRLGLACRRGSALPGAAACLGAGSPARLTPCDGSRGPQRRQRGPGGLQAEVTTTPGPCPGHAQGSAATRPLPVHARVA